MTVPVINDHIDQALNKLVEQYKGSEKIQDIIRALLNDTQELENASEDLYGRLDVLNAVGVQLDRIGEIVGQSRDGNDDDFYRTLILTRIGINLSNGEPETVIGTFKVLTDAGIVNFQEFFDGSIGLFSDASLPSDQLVLILDLMNRVLPAGVRIAHVGEWDPDCNFAFDGDVVNTQGFGDENDSNIGGCFARLYVIGEPFAFDGPDVDTDGFGTLEDPVLGGLLQGL